MAGKFPVNVNKSPRTDFSLERPQNDIIANTETSMFSGESGHHKSISSIPKKLVKLSKTHTKNNYRLVTVSIIAFKQSK